MLKLHGEITESVKFDVGGSSLEGRKAVAQILLIFVMRVHRRGRTLPDYLLRNYKIEAEKKIIHGTALYRLKNISKPDKVSDDYVRFYDAYQGYIGHYFRNLYLILKFIDRSDLGNEAEKKFYTNLLRAQLSSDELLFVFYNCTSPHGGKKLKLLVEKYEFFEHLPVYNCLNQLENVFDNKAFGKSKSWNEKLMNLRGK